MRLRQNILVQYSVGTFLAVLVFALVLGAFLGQWTVDLQISKHIDLYPEIAELVMRLHPEAVESLSGPDAGKAQALLEDMAQPVLASGKVFRVKIWGQRHNVLWSNEKSIIGQQYPDDDEYQEAWLGRTVYSVAKPDKTEQLTESGHDQVLEIYLPIRYQGQVVAVFELYEGTDSLFAGIQGNVYAIWLIVGVCGLVLYLLLFVFFFRAHQQQTLTNKKLLKTQEVIIMAMANIAETRDNETGQHIQRTQKYVELLALALRGHPRFRQALSRQAVDLVVKSSSLHDIGKVGIPDNILLKPGKLSPEEFETIKRHTVVGRDALTVAQDELGSNAFLDTAREIAWTHHEKWDGSGYPRGLRGEEIPVSGRIMAVADVYDALMNKRVYKDAFDHESTMAIIKEGAGKHFDPDIVAAFLALEADFARVARTLAD